MLSDRRTNGHGQREALSVGERTVRRAGMATRKKLLKMLSKKSEIRSDRSVIIIYEKEMSTGVFNLSEKGRLDGLKVEEGMTRSMTSFASTL